MKSVKRYQDMSAGELADATRVYEGMVIDQTKPLNAAEQRLWESAKELRRRPDEAVLEMDALRYRWSALTSAQVGRFAEYFAKMEFALYGFEVFTSEVDDRGIDFVARIGTARFLEIQVKSLRKAPYTFMKKDQFPIREDRYLALAVLSDGKVPDFYLIPSTAWQAPNALLKRYSAEWGIQLSREGRRILQEQYRFDRVVCTLTDKAA